MKKLFILFSICLFLSACGNEGNDLISKHLLKTQTILNQIAEEEITIKKITISNIGYSIELSDGRTIYIDNKTEGPIIDEIQDMTDFFVFRFIDKKEIIIYKEAIAFIRNNPLCQNPSKLKILGIGNSFTEDAMIYLPELIQVAGLSNITIARVFNGGTSLQQHNTNLAQSEKTYYYQKTNSNNKWKSYSNKFTLQEVLTDEDWDIIVLQQVSQESGQYKTFQPHLNNLIKTILEKCSNKKVSLAWHMTWAYASNSTHSGFPLYNNNQMNMYKAIVDATKKMTAYSGIDIVIPSGTALQNLRGSYLNNPPADLTRDGFHSDYGAARYVEACTWFETLINPCYKVSIIGNTYRVNAGNVPVTNENAEFIQKAAQLATLNKYEISILK